jgi:Domain of unknown function (DUF6851)
LRRPADEATRANKTKAISFAAYRVLLDLFASQPQIFDTLMTGLGYDPLDLSTDIAEPSGIGNVVAKAILDFRHADGSNQLGGYADTTGYQPVNTPDAILDPNRWQPLRVADGQGGFIVQRNSSRRIGVRDSFRANPLLRNSGGPPRLLPEDEAGGGKHNS